MSTQQNHPEDIIKWSDNTWCYREELHQMSHMSDDYVVLPVESAEWFDFLALDGI